MSQWPLVEAPRARGFGCLIGPPSRGKVELSSLLCFTHPLEDRRGRGLLVLLRAYGLNRESATRVRCTVVGRSPGAGLRIGMVFQRFQPLPSHDKSDPERRAGQSWSSVAAMAYARTKCGGTAEAASASDKLESIRPRLSLWSAGSGLRSPLAWLWTRSCCSRRGSYHRRWTPCDQGRPDVMRASHRGDDMNSS